jgi:hypothetical protein
MPPATQGRSGPAGDAGSGFRVERDALRTRRIKRTRCPTLLFGYALFGARRATHAGGMRAAGEGGTWKATPMTRLLSCRRAGPPEFPGLTAASIWTHSRLKPECAYLQHRQP